MICYYSPAISLCPSIPSLFQWLHPNWSDVFFKCAHIFYVALHWQKSINDSLSFSPITVMIYFIIFFRKYKHTCAHWYTHRICIYTHTHTNVSSYVHIYYVCVFISKTGKKNLSFLRSLLGLGLWQPKMKNWEFKLNVPYRNHKPKYLNHHLPPIKVHSSRKLDLVP